MPASNDHTERSTSQYALNFKGSVQFRAPDFGNVSVKLVYIY